MRSSGGVPPRRASWLEDSLHTPPPRVRTVEAVGLKRERRAGSERSAGRAGDCATGQPLAGLFDGFGDAGGGGCAEDVAAGE